MDGDEGKKELRDFKEWLLTRNMFTPTREVKQQQEWHLPTTISLNEFGGQRTRPIACEKAKRGQV